MCCYPSRLLHRALFPLFSPPLALYAPCWRVYMPCRSEKGVGLVIGQSSCSTLCQASFLSRTHHTKPCPPLSPPSPLTHHYPPELAKRRSPAKRRSVCSIPQNGDNCRRIRPDKDYLHSVAPWRLALVPAENYFCPWPHSGNVKYKWGRYWQSILAVGGGEVEE